MGDPDTKHYRRGDMVQALTGNGSVPPGTVGRIVSAVNDPHLPHVVHVEWTIVRSSKGRDTTKKAWAFKRHVEPLTP